MLTIRTSTYGRDDCFHPCSKDHKKGVLATNSVNYWVHCRDTFHSIMAGKVDKSFVYNFTTADRAKRIKSFIFKVEKFLKKKRSSFRLTSDPKILHVIPSSFWTSHPLRFSLFTILLRTKLQSYQHGRKTLERINPNRLSNKKLLEVICHRNQYIGNPVNTIRGCELAVRKFFDGDNYYPLTEYETDRWVNLFAHTSNYRNLTKEPRKKPNKK